MAKRESVESKIISYFSEESDEKVQLLFGIIKGIVAKRAPKKSKEPKAASAGKKTTGPKEANPMPFGAPEPGRYEPVVDSKAS